MNLHPFQQSLLALLRQSVRTRHHRILTFGFLFGMCYLPFWAKAQVGALLQGSTNFLPSVGFVALGLHKLWHDRETLKTLSAAEEEQFVGYCILFGSAIAFPFLRSSLSMQSLVWAVALASMMYSTWGFCFFQRYRLASFCLLSGLYPDLIYLAKQTWLLLTPPNALEQWMAWAGAIVLRWIGQSATANDYLISLPTGGVIVGFACNGFEMALTMAIVGFLMGEWLELPRWKTAIVIAVGSLLALLFNVPRIVILTFAAVYWGNGSFEFWHGPWGGQIFSGILLTVYYYVMMGLATSSDEATDGARS